MDEAQALGIIRPLADGVDPTTGEAFPPDSPYQQSPIVRALLAAAQALEEAGERRRRHNRLPANAGQPWSDSEDARLAEGFDGGGTVAELAKGHQRTQAAIHARLVKLAKIEA